MFILDHHNYVRQGLQNVNSNLYRGLKPEQIDIALNRSMNVEFDDRYLLKGIGGSFESTTKRLGELSALVVENHLLDIIVACTPSGDIERAYSGIPVKFRANLPRDFAIFDNIQARVYYNDCGVISYSIGDITNYSYSPIHMISNPKFLGNNTFTAVQLKLPSLTAIDITAGVGFPAWSDYEFPQDAEEFVKHFITRANVILAAASGDYNKYRLHWESYNGVFYSEHFIISSTLSLGSTSEAEIILTGMGSYLKSGFSILKYKYIHTPSNGDYKIPDYVLREHYGLERTLKNAFHRPNSDKVIITQHEKSFNFYTDETYFVADALLSYIRRPKRMSLSMNQGCELLPMLHTKVGDGAITYLKGAENHPGYQQMMVESTKGD